MSLIESLRLEQLLFSENEDAVVAGLSGCLFLMRNFSNVTRKTFPDYAVFDNLVQAERKYMWLELESLKR